MSRSSGKSVAQDLIAKGASEKEAAAVEKFLEYERQTKFSAGQHRARHDPKPDLSRGTLIEYFLRNYPQYSRADLERGLAIYDGKNKEPQSEPRLVLGDPNDPNRLRPNESVTDWLRRTSRK